MHEATTCLATTYPLLYMANHRCSGGTSYKQLCKLLKISLEYIYIIYMYIKWTSENIYIYIYKVDLQKNIFNCKFFYLFIF